MCHRTNHIQYDIYAVLKKNHPITSFCTVLTDVLPLTYFLFIIFNVHRRQYITTIDLFNIRTLLWIRRRSLSRFSCRIDLSEFVDFRYRGTTVLRVRSKVQKLFWNRWRGSIEFTCEIWKTVSNAGLISRGNNRLAKWKRVPEQLCAELGTK